MDSPFGDEKDWHKFSVLTISPIGVMLDFQDQMFHLTLRWSWVFAFHWGAISTQYINERLS